MSERWTAQECADYWGIKRYTWTAYVSRGQAPPEVGREPVKGQKVWDAVEVRSRRPGAPWTSPATSEKAN